MISPTERQRLAGLRERLDGIAAAAIADCTDRVSVEDTACGAASVAIGRLLEALEASEAEVAALKKGVRSLMESRKKWKRRALQGGNATIEAPRPRCTCGYEVGSGAEIDTARCDLHAETFADAELAEDRADYFASTEETR